MGSVERHNETARAEECIRPGTLLGCFLHEMKPRSGRVEGGWSAGRGAVHGIEASDGLKCKKVAPWRPIYLHVNKEDLTEGIYLQSVGRRARNLFCSRKGDLTPGKWIPCTVQIKRRGEKFDLTPSLRVDFFDAPPPSREICLAGFN